MAAAAVECFCIAQNISVVNCRIKVYDEENVFWEDFIFMDQKQDDRLKYEKGILHIRYLFVIAGMLAVIGISIALGGDNDALGQISMASTVSSIILSAIAIFMSISGEYKLTYTHNKLLETSDRMSDITAHIESANKLLEDTIKEKFIKIDDIFVKSEQIYRSVGNMEKEVLNKSLSIKDDNNVNISKEVLWKVYSELIGIEEDYIEKYTKCIMEYSIVCFAEKAKYNVDNIEKYIKVKEGNMNPYLLGMACGLCIALIKMGVSKSETREYFKEKMALTEEKWNEIRKFL